MKVFERILYDELLTGTTESDCETLQNDINCAEYLVKK